MLPLFFLWVLPASTNYKLKSFEFGSGGGTEKSSNYQLDSIAGQVAGEQQSTNYKANSGLIFVQQANVPTVTLVNSSSWYDKLLVTIGVQNNPSDATYAIAISDDNWVTTKYVQNDNTVGTTLGTEDYQTYTNWGGASGEQIIGLAMNTTYKVKARAEQGDFTESPYGPEASASTSNVTLDFDIDISATDTETAAPYTVQLGSLTINGVTTATNKIWVDLSTNANNGGYVYIYDQYAGLKSTNINYTISSASTDLASATEGFGVRVDTTSSLTSLAPYNGVSDNVGLIDTTVREIFNSAGAPVTAGRASIFIKAKTSNVTPAANDYADTVTLISSATF